MLACGIILEFNRQMFGKAFVEALERYLEKTLHEKVSVRKVDSATSVPVFLERTYTFLNARIVGRPFMLIAARENAATPANIAKHVSLVRAAADSAVIFVTPSLSAHNRSRLISRGVAFVVPGNQLYIPDLAMDLRENIRAPKLGSVERLSPAAQAVFFHCMLRLDEFDAIPSAIAERLRYSPMSVGRAFDDLTAAGLAKTEGRGKERHIHFNMGRREIMEVARPFLRSPVRSFKYIRDSRPVHGLKLAGESALAKLTDLTPPQTETFAVVAKKIGRRLLKPLNSLSAVKLKRASRSRRGPTTPLGCPTVQRLTRCRSMRSSTTIVTSASQWRRKHFWMLTDSIPETFG